MRKGRIFSWFITAMLLAGLAAGGHILTVARADDLPPEAYVSGVIGHAQSHSLSCESRSAADWATYFGVPLSEEDILSRLPSSKDPETGFVGSPDGAWGNIPPHSYGVYPPPVVSVLNALGVPAQARHGLTWDELRADVAGGKPVIVWIVGQMWAGQAIGYQVDGGNKTVVAAFEHTMIVIGYNQTQIQVIDAYSGMTQTYPIKTFLDSWGVLENRAIVYSGEIKTQESSGPGEYTVQPGDFLTALAQRFDVDWQDLAGLNAVYYPFVIYPGQVLKIPGLTPTPGPAATAPAPQPTPARTATPAAPPDHYVVQAGDTLLSLAEGFHLDWQDLVDLNAIPFPYFIYPGQTLHLPPSAVQPPAPYPAPGATPVPSPTVPPTAAPPSTYTVQPGDFLIDLAGRFNMDWQDLAALNGVGYPYVIYPGQVLKLR